MVIIVLVSEALTEIRNKTNDRDMVGLDDSELLSYLNEAIQLVSGYLVGYDSPSMVKDLNITTSTYTLPNNFSRLAGIYPVKITGKTVTLLDTPPQKIRYFESYPIVASNGTMPYNHDALNVITIKVAAIYANAQQKLDVTQDQTLKQEIMQAISLAMGAEMGGKQ